MSPVLESDQGYPGRTTPPEHSQFDEPVEAGQPAFGPPLSKQAPEPAEEKAATIRGPVTPEPSVPEAISKALRGQWRNALVQMAEFLGEQSFQQVSRGKPTTVIFHLAGIGGYSCPVLADEYRDGVLVLVIEKGTSQLTPDPMSVMDMTFGPKLERKKMTFVAGPLPLPSGFPFDLFLFVDYNDPAMIKTGKLHDDAPSVVSGEPSDNVSEEGEPVKGTEKAASLVFDTPRDEAGEDADGQA